MNDVECGECGDKHFGQLCEICHERPATIEPCEGNWCDLHNPFLSEEAAMNPNCPFCDVEQAPSDHVARCRERAARANLVEEVRRKDAALERLHAEMHTEWRSEAKRLEALLKASRHRVELLKEQAESYRLQAEYEVEARMTAATFSRDRTGYIPCERCGCDSGMDAVVTNDVWAQISPTGHEGGVLCLWCMDELCVEKHVDGPVLAALYFSGKVILSVPYDGERSPAAFREMIEAAKANQVAKQATR